MEMAMKQITIRNIPDEVRKAIQREAAQKGLSLNKSCISLLERAVRKNKAPEKKTATRYHDLDHLAGLWSREEAAEFDKNVRFQRMIFISP
jgi:plasmid stability protein